MSDQQDRSTDPEQPGKKSPSLILRQEVNEGSEALGLSTSRLLLSAFSAGLDLSLSVLLMGIVAHMFGAGSSEMVQRIVLANAYSLGFIFVILGGSQLFTEQTSLAVIPVLAGEASISRLARLWTLTWAGNIAGVALFAAFLAWFGPRSDLMDQHTMGELSRKLLGHGWAVTLVSAILAGWLMGLLSWVVTASRETVSQIIVVWLVTMVIGLAHLHHSVLGAAEVMVGLFSGVRSMGDLGFVLFWSTLGNIIGGSVFVALLKYGHARAQ